MRLRARGLVSIGAAFARKIIDMATSMNMADGVTSSEFSSILKINKDMLAMLTDMSGEIYKTYRIYQKTL